MIAKPEDLLEREVSISINDKNYTGRIGETILDVAKRNNIDIPHLCFKDGMRPDGNCRACVVEIEGERTLQPSCVRTISEGMKIQTSNKKVVHSQKLVLELLGSDISDKTYNSDSELDFWSKNLGISESRFPSKIQDKHDSTCLLYTSPSPRDRG